MNDIFTSEINRRKADTVNHVQKLMPRSLTSMEVSLIELGFSLGLQAGQDISRIIAGQAKARVL